MHIGHPDVLVRLRAAVAVALPVTRTVGGIYGVEEIVEGGLNSQHFTRKVEGGDKLTKSRKAKSAELALDICD